MTLQLRTERVYFYKKEAVQIVPIQLKTKTEQIFFVRLPNVKFYNIW